MLSRWAQRGLQRCRQSNSSALKASKNAGLWQRQYHSHEYSAYYKRQLPNAVTPYVSCRSTWRIQQSLLAQRHLVTSSIPSILLPPVVFAGLLIALWTWKCLMMVLFQDKIIYMPSMPPFARREKVEDYTDAQGVCNGVKWENVKIRSADGVRLSVLIGRLDGEDSGNRTDTAVTLVGGGGVGKNVFIAYFQGNGSSLPPRLPVLSSVLKSAYTRNFTLKDKAAKAPKAPLVRYTLLALSYRGYWTSSGRATQAGIELDAAALLEYITTTLTMATSRLDTANAAEAEIVLWGQSIGAGVATTAAATYTERHFQEGIRAADVPRITGIVMETPFTSVKNMLIALYPQKWLPYRYLHPFLWNRWDSEVAIRRIVLSTDSTREPSIPRSRVLLLPATRDEVVPPGDADKLEGLCKEVGLEVRRVDVLGALHHEATLRKDGQEAITGFIVDSTRNPKP